MEDKKTVLLQSVVRPYREPRYMNKQGRFTDETLPKTPQAEDIPSSLNDQTEPKDGVATWTHSKSRIRGALHTSTIRRINKKGQYLWTRAISENKNTMFFDQLQPGTWRRPTEALRTCNIKVTAQPNKRDSWRATSHGPQRSKHRYLTYTGTLPTEKHKPLCRKWQ